MRAGGSRAWCGGRRERRCGMGLRSASKHADEVTHRRLLRLLPQSARRAGSRAGRVALAPSGPPLLRPSKQASAVVVVRRQLAGAITPRRVRCVSRLRGSTAPCLGGPLRRPRPRSGPSGGHRQAPPAAHVPIRAKRARTTFDPDGQPSSCLGRAAPTQCPKHLPSTAAARTAHGGGVRGVSATRLPKTGRGTVTSRRVGGKPSTAV